MKPERQLPKPVRVTSPDGAELKGNATVTGLVKTTKGFATAIVELSPDGAVVSVRLLLSQSEKRFVAMEHKREVVKAAMRA